MNPFMAFCLYVAARVFVQYLKKMPDDQEVRQSLEFLLAAMQAIQRQNPLTESFLVQLNMDIEGSGLDIYLHNPDYSSQYVSGTVSLPEYSTISLQPQNHQLIQSQDANRQPAAVGSKTQCSPIFHISETSEDGRSSGEGLSPQDTRLPKDDLRKSNPTLRTEDPRQRTYAFRNADTIGRERGNSRPYFPENVQSHPYLPQDDFRNNSDVYPQRLEGIFPSNDWNQGNMATVANLDVFTDNDRTNAISTNNQHLDTEMAEQSANSRGPTPQSNSSYKHSSSNTSYSPSQAYDDDQTATFTGGVSNYTPGFAPPSHKTTFTGEGVKRAMSPLAQQQEDAFKIPSGWDLGTGMTPSSGMTPGSLAGMTPEGGWEKLLDSMGWETGRTG